jgi:hypothetical protein
MATLGAECRVLREGLGLEDVESGTGDGSLLESLDERGFVDQSAAGAIDEAHPGLAPGQCVGIDEVASLFGERRVDRQKVGPGPDLFQLAEFDTQRIGRARWQEGVVHEHGHSECLGPDRDLAADPSHAQDAEGLRVEFDSHQTLLAPLAGVHARMAGNDVAAQRHQQGPGVLGRRERVLARGIHHDHPAFRRGLHIDVVHPGPRPPDHPQSRRGVHECGVHRGGAPYDEGIAVGDRLLEILAGLPGTIEDIVPRAFQDLSALGGDGIGKQDLHRVASSFSPSAASKRPSRCSRSSRLCSPMCPIRKVSPFSLP